MLMRWIVPIPVLLLLAACSTVQFGRDFDIRKFEERVQRGVSTQSAVREWLGEPSGRGAVVNEQGVRYEEWSYYQGRGTLPNLQDAQLRILQIRFDAQGRVASYSWVGESGN